MTVLCSKTQYFVSHQVNTSLVSGEKYKNMCRRVPARCTQYATSEIGAAGLASAMLLEGNDIYVILSEICLKWKGHI